MHKFVRELRTAWRIGGPGYGGEHADHQNPSDDIGDGGGLGFMCGHAPRLCRGILVVKRRGTLRLDVYGNVT